MPLPQVLLDIIHAPRSPVVSLSPDHRLLLLAHVSPLPPLAELAQGELRLAGVRFNPHTHAPSRGAHLTRLSLLRIETGDCVDISGFPEGARIRTVVWSPDSRRLAACCTQADGSLLWLVDAAAATARRLLAVPLNATLGAPITWAPDSQSLICRFVVPDALAPPGSPLLGPVIQENDGRAAPARTFQDVLKNAHDEALFDHYLTAQLARVQLDGNVQKLGKPAIYIKCEPSPDGRWLLVESLRRPYSYQVPARRFPRRVEVWKADGTPEFIVAELPLADDIGPAMDDVRRGPRHVDWRADAPATLVYAEPLDGGDVRRSAERRDRIVLLSPTTPSQTRVLAELEFRIGGLIWGHGRLALLREQWWKTRRDRLWRVRPDEESPPTLLFDRSYEDHYHAPGDPLVRHNAAGRRVLLSDDGGETIFLAGAGASPQGNRPFVDRYSLLDGKSERLWQCEFPYYEEPVAFLDDEQTQLLTQQESVQEPPNCLVRFVAARRTPAGKRAAASACSPPPRRLTHFPHPTPQLREAQKELIRYQRADGLECSARLYTPPAWRPGDGPLPTLLWAYPREYKDSVHAGQLTDSPHRFVRVYPYSPLIWLTQGYAVLDGPTLAVVGQGEAEPNDTYIEQLVAGAKAAVDEVVRRGVADPRRIAVGGHSYGAAMAAILLAHSDLFCAGIGLSGAYNRTLTPFGFQHEERTLWQAPEVYLRMSPIMAADRINRPLLLIHGQADENAGTHPLQSERFFQALKGLGKSVRLVLLPYEGHGYEAEESITCVVEEIFAWLERHVKLAAA